MEARFLKVSILAGCLKLEVVAWIVGLSSAIFNNNGQLVPNAFLESLKIFVKWLHDYLKMIDHMWNKKGLGN